MFKGSKTELFSYSFTAGANPTGVIRGRETFVFKNNLFKKVRGLYFSAAIVNGSVAHVESTSNNELESVGFYLSGFQSLNKTGNLDPFLFVEPNKQLFFSEMDFQGFIVVEYVYKLTNTVNEPIVVTAVLDTVDRWSNKI